MTTTNEIIQQAAEACRIPTETTQCDRFQLQRLIGYLSGLVQSKEIEIDLLKDDVEGLCRRLSCAEETV